jgi:hypothetical protein
MQSKRDDWDDNAYDGEVWPSDDEQEPPLPGRPYCAKCNKLKGSKIKGRFNPEQACVRCGTTETVLRNKAGKTIDWKKWTELREQKRYEELMAENSDYYSRDYY